MYIKTRIEEFINENIDNNILLLEEYANQYDWLEYMCTLNFEMFNDIKNGKKIVFNDLIPKNSYHKALKEVMEFGDLVRFPTNKILDWKMLVLENIGKLKSLTEIQGHSSNFPFDEFLDVFNYYDYDDNEGDGWNENGSGEYSKWLKENDKDDNLYDFSNAFQFLDNVYNVDDILPTFSNGQYLVSDYGLEPLLKLGVELINEKNSKDILIIINRILDVTHQRSDLAELFIEGGIKSLDYISNS